MNTEVRPDTVQRITVHNANSLVHNTANANYESLDSDLLEFVLGDVLHDQETLYQSILNDVHSDHARDARTTAPSNHSYYHHGESSNNGTTTSRTSDVNAQIAFDEAFARQLQEMENLSIETPRNEDGDISCVDSPSENSESTNDNNEVEAERQGDVDLDNMTYEQRQAFGESLGTEDTGLSDELISYLETKEYKTSGFFSRKATEDCVICQSTYKNREKLKILPCKHQFHGDCITKWLKMKRTCPVCKYEVFGPS